MRTLKLTAHTVWVSSALLMAGAITGFAPTALATGRTGPAGPAASLSTSGSLSGVAATSAGNAWAVGATSTGKTLIVRWNGSAWKRVPSPITAAGSGLQSVSATSARSAWAVGFTGSKTLILRWNGSSGKRVPSPSPGGPSFLLGVAATSARSAWAVGTANVKGGLEILHHRSAAASLPRCAAGPAGQARHAGPRLSRTRRPGRSGSQWRCAWRPGARQRRGTAGFRRGVCGCGLGRRGGGGRHAHRARSAAPVSAAQTRPVQGSCTTSTVANGPGGLCAASTSRPPSQRQPSQGRPRHASHGSGPACVPATRRDQGPAYRGLLAMYSLLPRRYSDGERKCSR